jgi:hypothetical protein
MNFTNKRACELWCGVGNELWLEVEKTGRPFEKKRSQIGDPILAQPATAIKESADVYRETLAGKMDDIYFRGGSVCGKSRPNV